jgi:hypothetical protein
MQPTTVSVTSSGRDGMTPKTKPPASGTSAAPANKIMDVSVRNARPTIVIALHNSTFFSDMWNNSKVSPDSSELP